MAFTKMKIEKERDKERWKEGERVCVLREMVWINGVKVLQQECGKGPLRAHRTPTLP